MLLHEYIDNPMGKGSNAIYNRDLVKSDMISRYDKNIEKGRKLELEVYNKGEDYVFHFIIPSESDKRDNTYDVLIHFHPEDPSVIGDKNLNRYNIKFFSNCPSFTYTYAYAFNKKGLLIDALNGKYGKEVLDNAPSTRNPNEIINYEKSLFFACHYLDKYGDNLDKFYLKSRVKKLKNDVYKNIRNIDKISFEVKQKEAEFREEKKKLENSKKSKTERVKSVVKGTISKITPKKKTTGIGNIKGSSKITAKKSSVNKIKPR